MISATAAPIVAPSAAPHTKAATDPAPLRSESIPSLYVFMAILLLRPTPPRVWNRVRGFQTKVAWCRAKAFSHSSSARNELHQYGDDRQYQQQVDESTEGVRADDSQQPQQQQH